MVALGSRIDPSRVPRLLTLRLAGQTLNKAAEKVAGGRRLPAVALAKAGKAPVPLRLASHTNLRDACYDLNPRDRGFRRG